MQQPYFLNSFGNNSNKNLVIFCLFELFKKYGKFEKKFEKSKLEK